MIDGPSDLPTEAAPDSTPEVSEQAFAFLLSGVLLVGIAHLLGRRRSLNCQRLCE